MKTDLAEQAITSTRAEQLRERLRIQGRDKAGRRLARRELCAILQQDAHVVDWHVLRGEEEASVVATSVATQRRLSGASGVPEKIISKTAAIGTPWERRAVDGPTGIEATRARGKRGPSPEAGKRVKGRLSQERLLEAARRKAKGDRTEWEAMGAALLARHRLHELPFPGDPDDRSRKNLPSVMDQKAGSVIGRLCMNCEISQGQYDAAMKYLEDVSSYRQAISAPAEPTAVDLLRGYGISVHAENVEAKRRAMRRYHGEDERHSGGCRGAIQAAANRHRGANIFAALDYLVLRDEYFSHMIRDAKLGLDALVDWYGIAS